MIDLTRGVRIPTDLDCEFSLTRWDEEAGEVEWIFDEGTPIGVHEFLDPRDGCLYRVTVSVERLSHGGGAA